MKLIDMKFIGNKMIEWKNENENSKCMIKERHKK